MAIKFNEFDRDVRRGDVPGFEFRLGDASVLGVVLGQVEPGHHERLQNHPAPPSEARIQDADHLLNFQWHNHIR